MHREKSKRERERERDRGERTMGGRGENSSIIPARMFEYFQSPTSHQFPPKFCSFPPPKLFSSANSIKIIRKVIFFQQHILIRDLKR